MVDAEDAARAVRGAGLELFDARAAVGLDTAAATPRPQLPAAGGAVAQAAAMAATHDVRGAQHRLLRLAEGGSLPQGIGASTAAELQDMAAGTAGPGVVDAAHAAMEAAAAAGDD